MKWRGEWEKGKVEGWNEEVSNERVKEKGKDMDEGGAVSNRWKRGKGKT